jgi:REP element-mobilizing transposase RayT
MPYEDLLKGRVQLSNYAFHIVLTTHDRKPIFNEFKNARQMILAMKYADEHDWCVSLCFVVMPDHIHWLVQARSKTISKLIASVKRFVSRSITGVNRVWQKGFYDSAIRNEMDIQPIARYIVANPLRANLVKSVKDYPHWDAIWL